MTMRALPLSILATALMLAAASCGGPSATVWSCLCAVQCGDEWLAPVVYEPCVDSSNSTGASQAEGHCADLGQCSAEPPANYSCRCSCDDLGEECPPPTIISG